ncbi:uncharacterized protein BO80DRAFT_435445 [Aspergillus ibericus CBS 121593]|uniref:Fungal lipase-type domain-containing protein n=1 Tax=Aspergillus ibericus CBS 121593 TaxID=1448316 RepID=A0A395GWZ1_9EURO|nr:hypothetical protein BO80DRAFT_435445 [Aspergillus ibericus CBS 121593]RAL00057.1 hypothetical protein BO80DRAFT_435445 [Aspergillus ibericus CBS 121593]
MDWMVNGNGEPITPSQSIGEPAAGYHKGYLAVAEAMQMRLAEGILVAAGAPRDMGLLFTGHSAGGGMAQLFYAMAASKSSSRTIATVVPNFRRVHCIVFGTPPIATIPIRPPSRDPFQSGIFLGIINEEDPVPLLQQGYLSALIEVLVRSPRELKARYPDGFKVPDPVVRISGPCIVLRDTDPTNVESCVFDAVRIPAAMLERKLFRNVSAHNKDDYLKRCRNLRSIAASQDHVFIVSAIPKTQACDTNMCHALFLLQLPAFKPFEATSSCENGYITMVTTLYTIHSFARLTPNLVLALAPQEDGRIRYPWDSLTCWKKPCKDYDSASETSAFSTFRSMGSIVAIVVAVEHVARVDRVQLVLKALDASSS